MKWPQPWVPKDWKEGGRLPDDDSFVCEACQQSSDDCKCDADPKQPSQSVLRHKEKSA